MSVRLVYFLFVSLAAVPGLGGDSAVFVLDTSGSMAGENAESQVESVGVLIPCLPATMSVGVVTFNHEARVLHPLTPLPEVDRGAWIEELRGVAPNGGTDILAGVQRGLELLETGGALVVLGDGLKAAVMAAMPVAVVALCRMRAFVRDVFVLVRHRGENVSARPEST